MTTVQRMDCFTKEGIGGWNPNNLSTPVKHAHDVALKCLRIAIKLKAEASYPFELSLYSNHLTIVIIRSITIPRP